MAEIGGLTTYLKMMVDTQGFAKADSALKNSSKIQQQEGKKTEAQLKRDLSFRQKMQQQMIAGDKRADQIQRKLKNDALKAQKESTDNATSSIKWMMGAAIAAIAVMKKFGEALGESWGKSNGTMTFANQLGISASRLTSMKNTLDVATSTDTGNAAASSMASVNEKMKSPTAAGSLDQSWVTALGLLGNKTGNKDLNWTSMFNKSSDDKWLTIQNALATLAQKDATTAQILGKVLVGDVASSAATGGFWASSLAAGEREFRPSSSGTSSGAGAARSVVELQGNLSGIADAAANKLATAFKPLIDALNRFIESNGHVIGNVISNTLNPGRLGDIIYFNDKLKAKYFKDNPNSTHYSPGNLDPEWIDSNIQGFKNEENARKKQAWQEKEEENPMKLWGQFMEAYQAKLKEKHLGNLTVYPGAYDPGTIRDAHSLGVSDPWGFPGENDPVRKRLEERDRPKDLKGKKSTMGDIHIHINGNVDGSTMMDMKRVLQSGYLGQGAG